jgi:porphobilinogen synthase
MDPRTLKFRRFRPLRATAADRDQNAAVGLAASDFILPYFVVEGEGIDHPLPTLQGVSHLSIDRLVAAARVARAAGIDKVLLFGVVDPEQKSADAQAATRTDSLVARAVAALKKDQPTLVVMTDVCVCAYMDHGHCGVLRDQEIDNDASLPLLADMALAHAQAGADVVAPSAMMDGQVAAIRARLDEAGFSGTQVMGYSAKYASKLYGPFRDAAASAPSFGDRKTYQMDPRAPRSQGVDEAVADLEEGASTLMVKPSTWYLDVVAAIKARFPEVPLAAYHTSGEAMLLRHGAAAGLFSWEDGVLENFYALKRAGTDLIITYDAVAVAGLLTKRT